MYQPMTCLVLKMIYYNLSLIHHRLATSSTYRLSTRGKKEKQGEFKTPPRPTGRRSKNINSQDVFEDLTNFRVTKLNIALKHPNFYTRAILNLFEKKRTPAPGFETFEFQNFFVYSISYSQVPKQSMLIKNFIL